MRSSWSAIWVSSVDDWKPPRTYDGQRRCSAIVVNRCATCTSSPVMKTLSLVLFVAAAGCSHPDKVKPARLPWRKRPLRSPRPLPAPKPVSTNVSVGDDLAKQCSLKLGNTQAAPKFDYDTSELEANDRDVLQQIATCVTTGPLKGKKLELSVAPIRAAPRSTTSASAPPRAARSRRTSSTSASGGQLGETTRGALDATGTDDASWCQIAASTCRSTRRTQPHAPHHVMTLADLVLERVRVSTSSPALSARSTATSRLTCTWSGPKCIVIGSFAVMMPGWLRAMSRTLLTRIPVRRLAKQQAPGLAAEHDRDREQQEADQHRRRAVRPREPSAWVPASPTAAIERPIRRGAVLEDDDERGRILRAADALPHAEPRRVRRKLRHDTISDALSNTTTSRARRSPPTASTPCGLTIWTTPSSD